MKPHSVIVLSFCILGALAQDSTLESVSDILKIYNECRDSEGLTPCLKMKALTLIDRVSRMEKLELMDGVVIKGAIEDAANTTTLEEEEMNLPRDIDAKSKALTEMIVDRVARAIAHKKIEISVPDLGESAREARFGDEMGKKKMKLSKKEKKLKMLGIKAFIMSLMAKKMAMIPLYLGALFILAVKALAQAKIALLIVGVIIIKKLLASKGQGHGGTQVKHASAGWSSGGSGGGWSSGGSGGGWSAGGQGGGWDEGGWDKRSIDVAHDIAYNGQKPT